VSNVQQSQRIGIHLAATALLLLILNQLNVVFRDVRIRVHYKVFNVSAEISLYSDLFTTAGYLGHRAASSEFLSKLLGHLLDVVAEELETLHCRDIFALIALDSFDYELAVGPFLSFTLLSGFSLGSFLLRVFLSAFSLGDGKGCET
jgi:hypothetical protein